MFTLDNMLPVATILVLIGIVLGIGLYVMSQTNDSLSDSVITVNNETLNLTDAGNYVSNSSECGFRGFSIVIATNASGNATAGREVIASANFTVDASTGLVSCNACDAYNSSNVNLTYSYTGAPNEEYCEAMDSSILGLGEFSDWISVIVVVIAAAIVLGIVLNQFGREPGV